MADRTIPEWDAKENALALRQYADAMGADHADIARRMRQTADLLDPRPASLREQVHVLLEGDDDYSFTDAVLAVVAEAPIEQILALVGPRLAGWLAAQPLCPTSREGSAFRSERASQRDHDVRLILGEAS